MSLEIGPYVVDVETGHVSKAGERVKWGIKAKQLFTLLLQNSPQTITKETILAEVWKGRVVTENSLYKTISKLRQELNPDGIEIESVFGEGYRIMATSAPIKQKKTGILVFKRFDVILAVGLLLVLSIVVYRWMSHNHLVSQMVALDKHLAVTKQAFISQIYRRNELGDLLSQRFELSPDDSWEKRFYLLYDEMNEQELFLCQQTRAYTEGPIFENNQAVLALLNNNPQMVSSLPLSQELISHLTLWLNKYERVFKDSKKMCLLYVGVEDGAKYPSDFDQQLKNWIENHQ
ncbi:winged helix-turn-helix domain-containing protein [Marinicella sp. S1101]|uniref:winged helix-turn-helix domain-containing protein n=1 Tax=Marinicella marina TaxID=2996016 RepID=UPI002260CC42|nr:winged helix-turn-helix domain-containing protein [Marinicella marina]MCX7552564.1 winged helix-turn-helix domain-containing protein [Marinicella marina]MDJ1139440.1 winged helix-turn-helix domain-containing protein [Marinicella marina]